MKKISRLLIFCCFINIQLNAQIVLDSSIAVKDFTVDMLGQCYAISGSEIIKLDATGNIISTYSKKDLGNPTSLDARDPLRLLVFYRDFGMIRILDNQLAEQSQLDLRQLGFSDVRLIAGNDDQSIWIYDRANAQLSKLDVRLQKSLLTVNIKQFLGKAIFPRKLEVSRSWIVLQNEKEQILLDQYGTYSRTIPLNYIPILFQLDGHQLLTGNSDSVEITDLNLFDSTKKIDMTLPYEAQKAVIFKDKIWYLKGDKLFLPKD